MADDEVAKRRARSAATPSPSARGRKPPPKAGSEKRPPLWRWFSSQVAHSDPARAAAARHVRERWDIAVKPFRVIDRSLAAEESPHLLAFRLLLDEYRTAYDIGADDDFAREVGTDGLLVPFAPEICQSCNREAIPGTGACGRHGGQWITPKDMADISRRIHDKLVTMSETALRVLQDLMDNGRSEQVRMMAATSILDRAGIGPHMNVNHSGSVEVTDMDAAAIELRGRLDRLAGNIVDKAAIADQIAGIVVDAEVVEEKEEPA